MDMCYSDFLLAEKQIERFGPNSFSHFLLAEKQIERFGPNPFSHFLLAEKQLEHFGEMFHLIPFHQLSVVFDFDFFIANLQLLRCCAWLYQEEHGTPCLLMLRLMTSLNRKRGRPTFLQPSDSCEKRICFGSR